MRATVEMDVTKREMFQTVQEFFLRSFRSLNGVAAVPRGHLSGAFILGPNKSFRGFVIIPD